MSLEEDKGFWRLQGRHMLYSRNVFIVITPKMVVRIAKSAVKPALYVHSRNSTLTFMELAHTIGNSTT